jgi:hypothetical protein
MGYTAICPLRPHSLSYTYTIFHNSHTTLMALHTHTIHTHTYTLRTHTHTCSRSHRLPCHTRAHSHLHTFSYYSPELSQLSCTYSCIFSHILSHCLIALHTPAHLHAVPLSPTYTFTHLEAPTFQLTPPPSGTSLLPLLAQPLNTHHAVTLTPHTPIIFVIATAALLSHDLGQFWPCPEALHCHILLISPNMCTFDIDPLIPSLCKSIMCTCILQFIPASP